jgi:hypothetical protein
MNQQNRKTRQLDSNAAALLAAARLNDEEVERVASAPHLLSSVWARIDAERTADLTVETRPVRIASPVFGFRVAFAAMALIVVAALGLVVLIRSVNRQPYLVTVPAPPTSVPRPIDLSGLDNGGDQVVTPGKRDVSHFVQQAGYKPPRRVAVRPNPVRQTAQLPPPLEFIALPAVQDTANAAKDARIVRVELPRASLVSLGANISIEGDKPFVKTDLLVGPDGVPRAIRLVE